MVEKLQSIETPEQAQAFLETESLYRQVGIITGGDESEPMRFYGHTDWEILSAAEEWLSRRQRSTLFWACHGEWLVYIAELASAVYAERERVVDSAMKAAQVDFLWNLMANPKSFAGPTPDVIQGSLDKICPGLPPCDLWTALMGNREQRRAKHKGGRPPQIAQTFWFIHELAKRDGVYTPELVEKANARFGTPNKELESWRSHVRRHKRLYGLKDVDNGNPM